jgi:hypothetical protein
MSMRITGRIRPSAVRTKWGGVVIHLTPDRSRKRRFRGRLIEFPRRLNGVFFGRNRANIFPFSKKIQCETFHLERAPRPKGVGEKILAPPPTFFAHSFALQSTAESLLCDCCGGSVLGTVCARPSSSLPRDRELIRQLAFIYVQQGEKA